MMAGMDTSTDASPAAWTRVSHSGLREALHRHARITGDEELYGYTECPTPATVQIRLRGYTALSYADAVAWVTEQTDRYEREHGPGSVSATGSPRAG